MREMRDMAGHGRTAVIPGIVCIAGDSMVVQGAQ